MNQENMKQAWPSLVCKQALFGGNGRVVNLRVMASGASARARFARPLSGSLLATRGRSRAAVKLVASEESLLAG